MKKTYLELDREKINEKRVEMCAATFCPLIAPKGSVWTGAYKQDCKSECAWFYENKCTAGSDVIHDVESVVREGSTININPVGRKYHKRRPMEYDCDYSDKCKWQLQQPEGQLCGPRHALKKGVDPRVCLF